VRFSRRYEDYPLIQTHYEGLPAVRCQAPIFGEDLEDVAITGCGIFDGGGDVWRPVKKSKTTLTQWRTLLASGGAVSDDETVWWPTEGAKQGAAVLQRLQDHSDKRPNLEALAPVRAFLRPNLVSLRSCRRVLIDGPTFQNSPAWGVHPWRCQDVTIRHVTVRNPWYAQNGDGIDIESCQRVLISQCVLDVGDDGICLKAGKIPGQADPTAFVRIEGCTVYHGHGGVVVGSEMSGGVHHVRVENCTFSGTDRGIRFKSKRGRGGVVEDIVFDGIRMIDIVHEAIVIDLHYSDGNKADPCTDNAPVFRHIDMRNVTVDRAGQVARLNGLPESAVAQVHLTRLAADAELGLSLHCTDAISIDNCRIQVAKSPWLEVDSSHALSVSDTVVVESQGQALLATSESLRQVQCNITEGRQSGHVSS
jgi:polygalacturonase